MHSEVQRPVSWIKLTQALRTNNLFIPCGLSPQNALEDNIHGSSSLTFSSNVFGKGSEDGAFEERRLGHGVRLQSVILQKALGEPTPSSECSTPIAASSGVSRPKLEGRSRCQWADKESATRRQHPRRQTVSKEKQDRPSEWTTAVCECSYRDLFSRRFRKVKFTKIEYVCLTIGFRMSY